jgi:hypothetical protein
MSRTWSTGGSCAKNKPTNFIRVLTWRLSLILSNYRIIVYCAWYSWYFHWCIYIHIFYVLIKSMRELFAMKYCSHKIIAWFSCYLNTLDQSKRLCTMLGMVTRRPRICAIGSSVTLLFLGSIIFFLHPRFSICIQKISGGFHMKKSTYACGRTVMTR